MRYDPREFDLHDVMIFTKAVGETGAIQMTVIHSISGVSVEGVGMYSETLKSTLINQMKDKIKERYARIKILTEV